MVRTCGGLCNAKISTGALGNGEWGGEKRRAEIETAIATEAPAGRTIVTHRLESATAQSKYGQS